MIEKTVSFEKAPMLALPTSDNTGFLFLIWGITASFFLIAILLCAVITIRRFYRNRILIKREAKKAIYSRYLGDIIKAAQTENPKLEAEPDCHIQDKTAIFLHYFRTLKGRKFTLLQDLISSAPVEEKIINSSFGGTRGSRMQAVKTLSYLNSQSSLEKIYGNLSSEDKYVRLTAARCLVRRKGLFFMNAIIEASLDGFPGDYKLLADILSRFGKDAVAYLESHIQNANDETSLAGCLEALVIIMPPQTTLNFSELMAHPTPAVRSATVALSAVVSHSDAIDPVRLGLTDEDVSVKIRAAKTAVNLKRSDLTSEFYALSSSSVMWLRYWSMRAIWASGNSGEKFVTSLSESHPMAANVAREMASGYV